MSRSSLRCSVMVPALTLAGLLGVVGSASAQAPAKAMPEAGVTKLVSSGNPSRDTMARLTRPITIDVTESRLEDVIRFISEFTGADIEPAWTTDRAEGLDKEHLITVSIKNLPALTAIEQVLAKAQRDFQENTWQLSSYGALEIGPKDVLNKSRRLVIYSINDLLITIPNYINQPQIDLSAVLSASQGGGGGQSPFTGTGDDGENEDLKKTRTEKANDLITLITTFVETNQWVDNGGEAGTIKYFNGNLLINAPDYIHRQIGGYAFWPSSATPGPGGLRSLSVNTGAGTSDPRGKAPATGFAGGSRPPTSTPARPVSPQAPAAPTPPR